MSDTTTPTTTAPAAGAAPASSTLFAGGAQPPATTTAAPPAAGAPPAQAAAEKPWSKWAPERRGFHENKGWLKGDEFNIESLAESYEQLEKFKGVPPDEAYRISKNPTPEELGRLHKRLGVPDAPDGYGLKAADGQDPTMLAEIAKAAHEAKVTPDQLKAFLGLNQKLHESQLAQREAEEAARFERDKSELGRDWGNALEQNKAIARRASELEAFKSEGLDEAFWAHAASYPGAGPAKIARALYKLGLGLGEDKFVTGQPAGGGIRTPEGAAAKKAELLSNKEYRAAYFGGDKAKMHEILELEAMSKGLPIPAR